MQLCKVRWKKTGFGERSCIQMEMNIKPEKQVEMSGRYVDIPTGVVLGVLHEEYKLSIHYA